MGKLLLVGPPEDLHLVERSSASPLKLERKRVAINIAHGKRELLPATPRDREGLLVGFMGA